jgi:excisionase family DNA binding protein
MTENLSAPKWLSRQEAALLLGLRLDDVDRLIATGLLDRFRIRGQYIRVRRDQVEELARLPSHWLRHA